MAKKIIYCPLINFPKESIDLLDKDEYEFRGAPGDVAISQEEFVKNVKGNKYTN